MTNQHPISPPRELVQQWWEEAVDYLPTQKVAPYIAKRAAQWGWDHRAPQIQEAADAELEACLALFQEMRPIPDPHVFLDPETRYEINVEITVIDKLIEAVRLQRRSLKHMALLALRKRIEPGSSEARLLLDALNLLPDNHTNP